MGTQTLRSASAPRRAVAHSRGPLRVALGLAARVRTRLRGERGQALPEFALVLLPLLLVLFGIVEFGLALNTEQDETHIANELARYVIVNQNPSCAESPEAQEKCAGTWQSWAATQGDNNFLNSAGEICISFPEGEEPGRPVRVVAKSNYKWLGVLKLKNPSSSLTGTAYMRLETVPTRFKGGGCGK